MKVEVREQIADVPDGLDLDDDASRFIAVVGGTITANIPYTSRASGKSGTAKRAVTARDVAILCRRLNIERPEARRLIIDTFVAWHAAEKTGFGSEWSKEFFDECAARYDLEFTAEPEVDPATTGKGLTLEQYNAMNLEQRGWS